MLLAEQWRDGGSALAGLTVAGFPNAYLIVGPNSCNNVIRARRRNVGERGPTIYPSGPHGY
ncbi:hypothetical protein GCM10027088_03700 [Nocardia goodfellowii]